MRNTRIARLSISTCARPREAWRDKAAEVLEQPTGQRPLYQSLDAPFADGKSEKRGELHIRHRHGQEGAQAAGERAQAEALELSNNNVRLRIDEHIDLDIRHSPAAASAV
ncbi:large subunit ribosomal protein L11e [Pancytospora philotis]|nr:large subunit ribosomal protein L11e [Pancytospora philotis]